jgi:hypothetical protein
VNAFPSSLSLSALALLVLAGAAAARGQSPDSPTAPAPVLTLGTGFDYSRGDYGYATDTEVFMVPLNLSYETGPWLFRASLPWLRVDGPASTVTGSPIGGVPGRPVTSSESGMGDATLGATYRVGQVFENVHLDLTGRVKFGTADVDKGLGTGKMDHYFQADFARSLGATTPFLSVGYRSMGASPQYPLRDGLYFSGGLVYRYSLYTSFGAAYDWRQRLIRGGDHASEAMVFLSHRFDDRWNVQTYALTGFSQASPDFGGGFMLNYRY